MKGFASVRKEYESIAKSKTQGRISVYLWSSWLASRAGEAHNVQTRLSTVAAPRKRPSTQSEAMVKHNCSQGYSGAQSGTFQVQLALNA